MGAIPVSWFDEETNGFTHETAYVAKTNILQVNARTDQQPVQVDSLHFAVPGQDIIVREYTFTNVSDQAASFSFIVHSSFLVSENNLYNTTMFNAAEDSLVHFRHKYYFALSSANVCTGYQSGINWDNVQHGELNGNNIDMKPDGALNWRINELAAGASVTIPVYITAAMMKKAYCYKCVLQKAKQAQNGSKKRRPTGMNFWLPLPLVRLMTTKYQIYMTVPC